MNELKTNSLVARETIIGFMGACLLFAISTNTAAQDQDRFCQFPDQADATVVKNTSASVLPAYKPQSIKDYKSLRVLVQAGSNACVISRTEQELLKQFAETNGLGIDWHFVEHKWQLLPELVTGNVDMIVAQDQDLQEGIQDQARFTLPWKKSTEKIVERANNSRISKVEDLAGRHVAAYKNSAAWTVLLEQEETLAGMVLEEIPSELSYLEVMERVKSGQYDLAVADSLFLDNYLPKDTALRAEFNITPVRNMAWAVQADAKDLHESLNQYLNQQYLTHDIATTYFDDLSTIKSRGILRVITNIDPSHYYLKNGKLYGFEYELVRKFASKHRLRVDVVLANSQQQMFEMLEQGKGDIVAASLPANILAYNKTIQFTRAYNHVSPVLVGRSRDEHVIDVRGLSGRRITLSEDSPYWELMLDLQEQGANFELVKADPGINSEGTMLMVALGMFDLTVVGNHQLKEEYAKEVGLKKLFNLSEPLAHRWAVRGSDQQLLGAINNFIDKAYRKSFYNVLHAKYFEQKHFPKSNNNRLTQYTSLSPYDSVTQLYASEYGFDWRLITALMFQESRFDPEAYSDAGAEGLMQIIPSTAELLGLKDTNNPEASINAGIRYLSYLRNKFEDTILLQDRTWFALASYNAGYGHVKKAREKAESMGFDRDKWFNNVEIVMLEMAKPFTRDGEKIRLCRCGQTVVYVREIRTRYFNYIRLMETQKVAVVSSSIRRENISRLN